MTWRVAKQQPDLSPSERDLVASALTHFDGQRYRLTAFVVMNDHVHVLLMTIDPYQLEDVIHSWKSFTAHRMERHAWQDEYFDRIVRNEKEFAQKFAYIQNNPWTRWPKLKTYDWVWPLDSGTPGGDSRPD